MKPPQQQQSQQYTQFQPQQQQQQIISNKSSSTSTSNSVGPSPSRHHNSDPSSGGLLNKSMSPQSSGPGEREQQNTPRSGDPDISLENVTPVNGCSSSSWSYNSPC